MSKLLYCFDVAMAGISADEAGSAVAPHAVDHYFFDAVALNLKIHRGQYCGCLRF